MKYKLNEAERNLFMQPSYPYRHCSAGSRQMNSCMCDKWTAWFENKWRRLQEVFKRKRYNGKGIIGGNMIGDKNRMSMNPKNEDTRIKNRIKRIEQLKAACDSISANANDFIGREEYPVRWEIDIVFEPNEAPVIELKRQSIPVVVFEKGLL